MHADAVAAALPELHFSVTRTLTGAGHAAVALSLRAVCKGALDRELTADGTPFVLEGIDLFQIAEGGFKISNASRCML